MIAKKRWARTGRNDENERCFGFTVVECPECGMRPPMLRLPDSLRQALLGGWTCEDCGCVMDRHGRRLETPPTP